MAENAKLDVENLSEQAKEITKAEPISWVFPSDINNNDGAIIPISPTPEIPTPSSRSIRKKRTPKTIPPQWIDNWIVKEKMRKDGSRTDKSFRHKKEGFKVRSFKLVTYYELYGKLPEPETKEKGKENNNINGDEKAKEILSNKRKKKDEKVQINVEEFLADAYNNLLHWFDK